MWYNISITSVIVTKDFYENGSWRAARMAASTLFAEKAAVMACLGCSWKQSPPPAAISLVNSRLLQSSPNHPW